VIFAPPVDADQSRAIETLRSDPLFTTLTALAAGL
jgi:hypothetical protein